MIDQGSRLPDDPPEIPSTGADSSLAARLMRLRRGPSTETGRRVAMAIALALFVGIGVQAYRSLPADRPPFNWTLLTLLLLVGTPAMLAANAIEYRTMSRLCGVVVDWSEALLVSVVATAANLLPIPGAALVRTVRLRQHGVSGRRIAAELVSIGVGFLAVACVALALSLLFVDELAGGGLVGAIGIGLVGVCAAIERREVPSEMLTRTVRLLATETFVLVVVVGRLLVVLLALGAGAGLVEAVMLGSASVLSTTLAFFPGGLGIREALSGLLGTFVGLDAATGAFAATLDRLTFLVGAAVVTAMAVVGRLFNPSSVLADMGGAE